MLLLLLLLMDVVGVDRWHVAGRDSIRLDERRCAGTHDRVGSERVAGNVWRRRHRLEGRQQMPGAGYRRRTTALHVARRRVNAAESVEQQLPLCVARTSITTITASN